MTPYAVVALVLLQAPSPAPSPSPTIPPLLAAPPAPAPAPAVAEVITPPTGEVLFELVKKVSGFAADTGRTAFKLTPAAPLRVPGVDDKGYFIEFQWAEKTGATKTGVAVVAHHSVLDVPWLVKGEGDWGLVQIMEERKVEGLLDELKRTRIAANEAMAVADVRSFLTGQMLFMALTNGSYGDIRCMNKPSDCIEGIPDEQMMEPALLVPEKRGYRRTFHRGERVTGEKAKGSPSPWMKSFAYTAVPITPGETGVRSFCGDPSGRICVTADGSAPKLKGAMCAEPCNELKEPPKKEKTEK